MSITVNDDENKWNKLTQSLNISINKISNFDPEDKFGLMIEFSDLAIMLDSFSECINDLIQKSKISTEMSKELKDHLTKNKLKLKQLKTQNEDLIKAIEKHRENQDKYTDLKKEHDNLTHQKQKLEKLAALDQNSLEEIKNQIETLKEQKSWLPELEKLNVEFEYELKDFIKCSEKTKGILGAEISSQLEYSKQLREEISSLVESANEIHKKVIELESEGEQMRENKEKLGAILLSYLHANKAVAQAIRSEDTITIDQKLNLIEKDLARIDKELSNAIKIYDDLQKERNTIIYL